MFDWRAIVDDHLQPVPPLPDGIILRADKHIHGFPRHHFPFLGGLHRHPNGLAGTDGSPGVGGRFHRPLGLSNRLTVRFGGANPLRDRLRLLRRLILGLRQRRPGQEADRKQANRPRVLHPLLLTPLIRP